MTDNPNIAFIGRAASGKTTAAKMLAASGYTHLGFADPIRVLGPMHAKNPNDWRDLITHWSYQFRVNDVLSPPEVVDLRHGILKAFETYPVVEGKNRDLLQNIGTHVGRGIDDALWIKLLLNRAEQSVTPVVLDDCRFPNEADALKAADWFLVYLWARETTLDARYAKLYGAPMTPAQKAHPSESQIPTLRGRCSYVIHNDGDDLNALYNEVEFVRDASQLIAELTV